MQNGFSPYEAETQDIDQRRKYAELLRQQGMAPLQAQSVGGMTARINPLEGLAKMLNAYSGSKGVEMASQERKDLMGRMDTERSTDMAALANALRGTPQTPQQFDPQEAQQSADQGTPMPFNPAVPGDPNQAAMIALQSRLPDVRQMAPGLMQIGETRANRQEDRSFRGEQAQAQRDFQMEQLRMRAEDQRASAQERAAAQKQLVQMQIDAKRDMAAMVAANRQQPQDQIIQTDGAIFARGRDGSVAPVIDPTTGQPLRPKGENKPLTEGQGKAVMFGQRAAQSDKVLRGLEDTINLEGLSTKRAAENMPLIGGIAGYVGNSMLSGDQQRVEQAQRDFVNAVLRQESGAVIAPSEFDNAIKQYFPRPGDSKEVRDQKRLNREIAIKGFTRMAGPGGSDIAELQAEKLLPSAGNRADAYSGPDRRNQSAPPPGAVREKK
jgi:hypothetical protein